MRATILTYLLRSLMLLAFAGAGTACTAQEHSYAHYDVRDGLAGATVYSMVQDKEGFMWFATETGVSRFDGTHFVNFTTHDGLPDNEILKLFVDSKNRIWIVPFKKDIGYYYKGKFHTTANDSLLRKLNIDEHIEAVFEDAHGNILLKEPYLMQFLDTSGHIDTVGVGRSPGIVFQTAGLNQKGEFRICLVGTGNKSNDDRIIMADVDKNGRFDIVRATQTSWWNNPMIDHIDPELETTMEYGQMVFTDPRDNSSFKIISPQGLVSVSRINDSSAVMNTYTSSFLVNLRQKKITDSFLSGQSVNSAMQDAEGNVWFSTFDNGVYRMSSSAVNEYYFKYNKTNLAIFSIMRADSILWLGGDHFNMYALNLRTHQIRAFQITGGKANRGRVMAFANGGGGKLIVGTDIGIYRFTNFDKKPEAYYVMQSVKTFQVVGDTQILSTSNKTMRVFDIEHPKITRQIFEKRTTTAYMAKDGSIYVGTLEGLYHMRDQEHKTFLGNRWPVLSNRIVHVASVDDRTFWVATGGDGVVAFRNDSLIAHLTVADGLTSNICRSLILANGDVWVGTDKGLNKISMSEGRYKITSFTVFDGLNSDMINAIYVDGSNIVVGTSEGLTSFNENNISRTSICLLRMTGITVSDRQLALDSTKFLLPHQDNNIKFDFTGISFRSGGNIVYSYRLLGLDTAWKTTKIGSLSYPSLPSGSYELQLFATNKFGVQSNLIKIPFTVDKLLRERIWFRLLLIALITGAVILYFNYRLRKVQQKEAEKTMIATKMAELEQMALRSQMNPHFIFNCLNSIQQYVIFKDVLGANEFITKFSYLIRQTLNLSAKAFISLDEEIDYIETYMALEKKRFDDKFIYEIVVDREVDRTECYIPPMILQPYIENAVRHGIGLRKDNEGRLWIRMQYREGFLVCIVEDNGVGREVASLYKSSNAISYQSVGMSLVSKRIEMLNRTSRVPVRIEIEDLKGASGEPLGTKISLFFPFEIVMA